MRVIDGVLRFHQKPDNQRDTKYAYQNQEGIFQEIGKAVQAAVSNDAENRNADPRAAQNEKTNAARDDNFTKF